MTAEKDDFFKARSVDDAIAFLQKKHGQDVIVTRKMAERIERLRTGFVRLDEGIGGGLPLGKIIEVFGPPGGGKTTFLLMMAAKVQMREKKNRVLYVDYEHAVDPEYARKLGVFVDDDQRWTFCQPSSAEEGLDVIGMMAYTGEYGMVISDSVAAMTPDAELRGEMGKETIGLQARVMGKGLRKLTSVMNKTGTLCAFINQERQKIGLVFGSKITTPGGDALKFYASMRIRVSSKRAEDGNQLTRFRVMKNKTSENQGAVAEYVLVPGRGFDLAREAFEICEDRGMIVRKGRKFIIKSKGGGKEYMGSDLLKALENESLRERLLKAARG